MTFECELSKPDIVASWLRDGKPLPEGEKYKTVVEGPTHRLVISDVDGEDEGDYSIVVRGKKSEGELIVEGNTLPNNSCKGILCEFICYFHLFSVFELNRMSNVLQNSINFPVFYNGNIVMIFFFYSTSTTIFGQTIRGGGNSEGWPIYSF